MAKPASKPAEKKPVANKQEKKQQEKAVKPKKQPANQATKKEEKPNTNAPAKQQNQKRKREENGSSVHDTDKKMKESPEAGVVSTGPRTIVYSNVPSTATIDDLKVTFADFSSPYFKLFSYRNKERVGVLSVSFRDAQLYEKALNFEPSVQGQKLVVVPPLTEGTHCVYVSSFPGNFDDSDVHKFFEGLEIVSIRHKTTPAGRVTGCMIVEFSDEQSKEAALQKNSVVYNEKPVRIFEYDSSRPRKPRAKKPFKKFQKKPADKETMEISDEKEKKPVQKQKPAAKKPNQAKVAPAKNAKQNKAAPVKKPAQNKPAQGKKAPAPKPGAKTAAKTQKSPAAKAQKKTK